MQHEELQLPYVSFKHLEDALLRFTVEGVPGNLQAHKFPISAAIRTQLLQAMRFLALFDHQGEPTPQLFALVSSVGTPRYPSQLAELLRRAFPELARLDLATATPSLLAEAIGHKTRSPDRARKALRFYLCLARRAEITIGPRLSYGRRVQATKPRSVASPPARRKGDAFLVREFIQKVPPFDPTWPETVQVNWLKAVGKLAERI